MLLVLLAVLMSIGAGAQEPAKAPTDQQTIQMLLQRIERLETRVAQLESTHAEPARAEMAGSVALVNRPPIGPAAGPAVAPPPPQQASVPSVDPEQETEHLEPERMDMSKTLLRMRGFGDITFHGSNQKGSTNSFSLGQLNLFVTSDISEKFKFLGEIVFESGPDNFYNVPGGRRNGFGVDVER
ncbi:MAG: hypothetical protein DMG81_02865 [Acidobacteria bacterium]|nr:MAG: hypothetical protein DMG81_02865 [Acidobacteriota bacterium]